MSGTLETPSGRLEGLRTGLAALSGGLDALSSSLDGLRFALFALSFEVDRLSFSLFGLSFNLEALNFDPNRLIYRYLRQKHGKMLEKRQFWPLSSMADAQSCLRDVKATVELYKIWKERLAG